MTLGAWLKQDDDHQRTYVTDGPMEVRHALATDETGAVTEWSEPRTITEFRVEIPPRFPNTTYRPWATWATDSASGGWPIWGSQSEELTYEDVLAELGVSLLEGAPPVVPDPNIPYVVGAVPTETDLPTDAEPLGVYLVRETGTGFCNGDEGWQSAPWTPDCADAFGITEADVPDLAVG